MKTWIKIAMGVFAATALVVVSLGVGWLLWGRRLWGPGLMGGPGMMSGPGIMGSSGGVWSDPGCGAGTAGRSWGWSGRGMGTSRGMRGPGMMQGGAWGTTDDCLMSGYGTTAPGGRIGIDDAREAVERYVADLGYDLEIAEMMEFELNYYAIVRERDTGVGAMELLVDVATGAVGPEMGPNMMWNTRYGMHARWARAGAENELTGAEAVAIAQEWLDEHEPGTRPEEHADPFYGYYTIHTVRDGEIEGMLSVHGETGQVWYHTWHGQFIQMVESDGDEH